MAGPTKKKRAFGWKALWITLGIFGVFLAIVLPIAHHPPHWTTSGDPALQYDSRSEPAANSEAWMPLGVGNNFSLTQILSIYDGSNWVWPHSTTCRVPEAGTQNKVYQYFNIKGGRDCKSGHFWFKSGPVTFNHNEQCPRGHWYDPKLDNWFSAPTDPSCAETTEAYCNGANAAPVVATYCFPQSSIDATLNRWRSDWQRISEYPVCKGRYTNCPQAVTNAQGAISALGGPQFSS